MSINHRIKCPAFIAPNPHLRQSLICQSCCSCQAHLLCRKNFFALNVSSVVTMSVISQQLTMECSKSLKGREWSDSVFVQLCLCLFWHGSFWVCFAVNYLTLANLQRWKNNCLSCQRAVVAFVSKLITLHSCWIQVCRNM